MKALERVPREAIEHLRSVCEKGGFYGNKYWGCYYGTLAVGCGYPVLLALALDNIPGILETVGEFAHDMGIEINVGGEELDAVEHYCYCVHGQKTVRTSPELAQIARWCDEEIERRDMHSFDPNEEISGKEILEILGVHVGV